MTPLMPEFRAKIARREPLWGAALVEPSNLAAQLTVNLGFDFLWIDTEHTPFGVEAVPMIPVLSRARGCAPIVRVATLDPGLIKKALDIGAVGVMVPQVNNAEEARLAVRYAKYPPEGSRGVSPGWTAYLNVSWDKYLPIANQETCVILQIETPEGIRNLEAIAAVEGVDVVFAGPMDISAALGHIGQIQHPAVMEFLKSVPPMAARQGKCSGISVVGLEACQRAYDWGYRFVNLGHILRQGIIGLAADLEAVRRYGKP